MNLATGQLEARYEYGPFGEPLRAEGGAIAEGNPFRWATKYFDAETGLSYYGHRYYSAEPGRWLSRDPIAESGGVNLYGMVGNDAVNQIDVLGLFGLACHCKDGKPQERINGGTGELCCPEKIHFDPVKLEEYCGNEKDPDDGGGGGLRGGFGIIGGGGGGFGGMGVPAGAGGDSGGDGLCWRMGNGQMGNFACIHPSAGSNKTQESRTSDGGCGGGDGGSDDGSPMMDAIGQVAQASGPLAQMAWNTAMDLMANYQATGSLVDAATMTLNPAYAVLADGSEAWNGISMGASTMGANMSWGQRTWAGTKAVVGAALMLTPLRGELPRRPMYSWSEEGNPKL